MEQSNKTAVAAMFQAWISGDSGALQAFLADDIRWTIEGRSAAAGTTEGRAELLDKVLKPFGARFATSGDRFRPRKVNGIYADGDTVIVNFDGRGTTNEGRPYENSYVWLLTMRDGKVAKSTAFFDSIAFNELWARQPAE